MLDQTFGQVYTKFKLHFYKQIFSRFEDREATLTTVESFCMEVIMALGEPTIAQFSHMMNLSTPNAAYKINSLVKKGYVAVSYTHLFYAESHGSTGCPLPFWGTAKGPRWKKTCAATLACRDRRVTARPCA